MPVQNTLECNTKAAVSDRRLAFTIPGAVEASGLSRTMIYEMIGAGLLRARKARARTIITADDLRDCIDKLPVLDAMTGLGHRGRPRKA